MQQEREVVGYMEKEERKVLFQKVVFIFVVGCVLGTYYEEILHVVKNLLAHGTFSWVSRRGLLYGPFSPIYGIAFVLVYLLFCLKKRKWYVNFIYGSLLGGFYEYSMSYLQEKLWGTISWDYSHHFLNIGGRTTIPFMFFWGVVVLLFIYVLYPIINHIYEKIPAHFAQKLATFLFVFLMFDASISLVAVSRQTMRHKGIEPKTALGEFCDEHYTDDYLRKIYDNSIDVNP